MSIGESVHGTNPQNADISRPKSIALGTVKENWNSSFPGAVRVNIIAESGKRILSDWMPVASPYAADGCGAYFLPEIGSTVIVGFIGDNSASPVVIGSIWNDKSKTSSDPPSGIPNSANSVKAFCTPSGQMIKIDESDGKKSIEIVSSSGQRLFLDDANEKLEIQSGDDNKISVDGKSGEICVEASKSFSIKIGGDCLIKADSSGVEVTASKFSSDGETLELKGSKSSIQGSAVEIKSSGNLNIESSGMAAVKGSMLKLN